MERRNINYDISNLPPEAQRQVYDFIDFIKSRYQKIQQGQKAVPNKIINEPFIGIWKNRKDMSDSSKWVRTKRESEWNDAN